MAPEILKLEQYDQAVDIWTIGVLLYELWHNLEPFKGDNPQMVLNSILTSSLQFDKRCPKEARDLIKYILNIDKNYRPKTPQVLNHPFLKQHGSGNQGAVTYPNQQGAQQGQGNLQYFAAGQTQQQPSMAAANNLTPYIGQYINGMPQVASVQANQNQNGQLQISQQQQAQAQARQFNGQAQENSYSKPNPNQSPYQQVKQAGQMIQSAQQLTSVQSNNGSSPYANFRVENNKTTDHYAPVSKFKDHTSMTAIPSSNGVIISSNQGNQGLRLNNQGTLNSTQQQLNQVSNYLANFNKTAQLPPQSNVTNASNPTVKIVGNTLQPSSSPYQQVSQTFRSDNYLVNRGSNK